MSPSVPGLHMSWAALLVLIAIAILAFRLAFGICKRGNADLEAFILLLLALVTVLVDTR